MHEVSLGRTIEDYLTGKQVEETTYEEVRQGLARMLVEEKGYAREAIKPRMELSYSIDGKLFSQQIDFGIWNGDFPLLMILFCPGEVGTFVRESLSAARLFNPPFPLVAVTDTKKAILLEAGSGKEIARGYQAIPAWEELVSQAQTIDVPHLSPENRKKEERIFYAYRGYGSCCKSNCST